MSTSTGTPLSNNELHAFLTTGTTARLACVDERGWPYVVPVWHQWDGERFWIIGAERAIWVEHVRRSPRIALTIDEPKTVTRVLCQGTARYVEGPVHEGEWVDIARQMAGRYLGLDAIEQYDKETAGYARWLFAVDIDRLVSWQGQGTTD